MVYISKELKRHLRKSNELSKKKAEGETSSFSTPRLLRQQERRSKQMVKRKEGVTGVYLKGGDYPGGKNNNYINPNSHSMFYPISCRSEPNYNEQMWGGHTLEN